MSEHFRKLENMYHDGAAINKAYDPKLVVEKGKATVEIKVKPDFFHAAGSLHGSVYFKAADDAAFFAANSLVRDEFVFTTDFHIQLIRPVKEGIIKAEGWVVQNGRNLILADANVYNSKGKLVAKGSGNFMKSGMALTEDIGYK